MINSSVNLDACRPNCSIKDMNSLTTNIGDLFIVVKISIEPTHFVG